MDAALQKKIVTNLFGTAPVVAANVIHVLERYEKVRAALAVVAVNEKSANDRFAREKSDIEKRRAEIRKECNHPVVDVHGDPSGGSDRCEECAVCGADLRAKEYRRS